MAPKKRARKKVKKTARGKKTARSKKPIRKKKAVRKVKRVAAPAAVRRKGGHSKTNLRKAAPPDSTLGEWHDDAGEELHQKTLFEEDIPPDYGGSK